MNSSVCPNQSIQMSYTCVCNQTFYSFNQSSQNCEFSWWGPINLIILSIIIVSILSAAAYAAKIGCIMTKKYQNASVLMLSISLFGLAIVPINSIVPQFVHNISITFLYYLGFLFWETMVCVQIMNLNYCFFGIPKMICPLKGKLNPESVKHYWVKVVVTVMMIVLALSIGSNILYDYGYLYNSAEYEMWSNIFSIAIEVIQFLLALLATLNAISFRKHSSKRIQSSLGTKQAFVAIISAIVAIDNCSNEIIQNTITVQQIDIGYASDDASYLQTIKDWSTNIQFWSILVIIIVELIVICSIVWQMQKEMKELQKQDAVSMSEGTTVYT